MGNSYSIAEGGIKEEVVRKRFAYISQFVEPCVLVGSYVCNAIEQAFSVTLNGRYIPHVFGPHCISGRVLSCLILRPNHWGVVETTRVCHIANYPPLVF